MVVKVTTECIQRQVDTLLVKAAIHPSHRLVVIEVISNRRKVDQVFTLPPSINIRMGMTVKHGLDLGVRTQNVEHLVGIQQVAIVIP